jgi:hypothetical protein
MASLLRDNKQIPSATNTLLHLLPYPIHLPVLFLTPH